MRRHLLLPWLLLLSSAVPAGAASFDCVKAWTTVERTICEDPTLSQADDHLAEAYATAMTATLAPEALRMEQNQWLIRRDKLTGVIPLRVAYQSRLDELTEITAKWREMPREIAAESAAKTCLLPPDPPDGICRVESLGSVGDALRYQIQVYRDRDQWSAGGVAVFRETSGQLTPLVVAAVDSAHFAAPHFARSGRLLVIPGHLEGTGNFNAALLYVVESDGRLRDIDTESWLEELQRRLPNGMGAWKGIYPDLETMTAETPIWKSGDGNCCPTGGRAFIRLELKDRRLAIADLRFEKGEAAASGRN